MSRCAVATLVLVIAAACSDPDAGPGALTARVDTLESGRVVVHNSGEAPAWTLVERFRVGAEEGTGPDVFGQLRDIDLGPDGTLYVLDGQPGEVRVFDPDGTYLRTLGSPGRGPGELANPGGVALAPDGTVWVADLGSARYAAFDARAGELLAEPRRLVAFGMLPWPGRFDTEGSLTEIGLGPSGLPAVLRLDSALIPADTLEMPEGDDGDRIDFVRDGRRLASVRAEAGLDHLTEP